MTQRFAKTLLAFCWVAFVFSACSKKYSTDDAITPQYSPSVIMGSNSHILYGINPITGAKNWELSLPGTIYASPLTYRGRLYIGISTSTAGNTDTLYKINPQTGKIVMRMYVAGASPFSIKATPIADGKLIYLATTNDSVYALDTGTAVVSWRVGIDGTSIESSPVLLGDQLYVATLGGTIVALDKTTGYPVGTSGPVWSYTAPGTGKSFFSSPAINDSLLFIGCTDSAVYCLNLKKAMPYTPGSLNWIFKTKGTVLSSPLAIAGRCIFGCSDYYVYSVDAITGDSNWHYKTQTEVVSSPVISADKSLIYIGGTDHVLYALEIAEGHVRWTYPTNGSIRSSPLVYKGIVYVGSYDQVLYAIDGTFGNLKWTKTIGVQMDCSPAVEDFTNVQHNSQISGYTNGVTN